MEKVKIGIIGCGKQGAKHLASLKKLPGVNIVLADTQQNTAKSLAEKERESWAPHPDDIFADKDIRGVAICTPTSSHVSLIENAINAEKEVFCEKPLSESIEEAMRIKEISDKSSRIVLMGYLYRLTPIFEEGHQLFRKLQINGESMVMGQPLSAFFRLGGRGSHQVWKHKKATNGGAINEMLVHMIDLANWYFGPLEKVEVMSSKIFCPVRVIQGEEVEVDAEDFILMKCTGAGGVEIMFQADLITPAFAQYLEIQSENGTFMGSIQSDFPSYVFLKESRGGYKSGKNNLTYQRLELYDTQMLLFVQSVIKREMPNINSVDDSIKLMQVLKQIRTQVEKKNYK